jgi:phosphoserine aminotransferase
MSFLRGADRPADHLVTGSWSRKAAKEARREGDVDIVWDGADEGDVRTPSADEYRTNPDAAYCHFTSNETIQGVQWPSEPATEAPLVCDMSSDFLSRPLELDRYALAYAGAQKNAGPAGLTVVLVSSGYLERVTSARGELPTMLDYRVHAEGRSMYNTPPSFSIYVLMLVTRWLRDQVGGLAAMARRNDEEAALLYDAIDASGGFYRGHADLHSRSSMNVTWRLPSEELERRFIAEAAELGMVELQGHRSVGGIRASLYNAMPVEGVEALRAFMERFLRTHA